MSERIKLTEEQTNTFCQYVSNDDRARAYAELRAYTGFSAASDMSQISLFSGSLGGIAKGANSFIESNNNFYPEEGVLYFSKKIADAERSYIKTQYENGQGITNKDLLEIAGSVWSELKMKNENPGNILLASNHAREALDNFFSKGTINAGVGALTNIFGGATIEDFSSPGYTIEYNSDYSMRLVTDQNKKAVFSEETGAVFNKRTGEYTYNYYSGVPIDKNELAAKLQISSDQISVETDSMVTRFGVSNYRISHKAMKDDTKPDIKPRFSPEVNTKKIPMEKKEMSNLEYKAVDFQAMADSFYQKEDKDPTQSFDKADKQRSTKVIGTSFQSIGAEIQKIGMNTANEDLSTIGSEIGSLATGILGYSTFTAETGLLAASGVGMMAVAAISFAALLFSSKGGNNGIAKSIEQIHKSLGIIRQEMHEEFFQAHKERFEIYELIYKHHIYISEKLNLMMEFENFVFRELADKIDLVLY